MNKDYKILSFDPSLNNWGIAKGILSFDKEGIPSIFIQSVDVLQHSIDKSKKRRNTKDIDTACFLSKGVMSLIKDADIIFAEVPIGSQSSRAMVSYGVCIGILGGIQAINPNLVQVTPVEVKKATMGYLTASKEEIINWVKDKHPEVNFPTRKHKGEETIITSKAEHMADAIGAIYAGIKTKEFQKLLN